MAYLITRYAIFYRLFTKNNIYHNYFKKRRNFVKFGEYNL